MIFWHEQMVFCGLVNPTTCALDSLQGVSSRDAAAGIVDCGKQIIRDEGTKSLWKGLTPFATHLTLKYALRMGTNAFYQSLLRDKVEPHCATHQCMV